MCVDEHEALLKMIGAILRKADKKERADLEATLKGHKRSETNETPQDYPASNSDSGIKNEDSDSEAVNNAGAAAAKLDTGRYVGALKEHGDRINQLVRYETEPLSLEPPQFRASVFFNGGSWDGKIEKTKKQARHQAAKAACESLSIRVPETSE